MSNNNNSDPLPECGFPQPASSSLPPNLKSPVRKLLNQINYLPNPSLLRIEYIGRTYLRLRITLMNWWIGFNLSSAGPRSWILDFQWQWIYSFHLQREDPLISPLQRTACRIYFLIVSNHLPRFGFKQLQTEINTRVPGKKDSNLFILMCHPVWSFFLFLPSILPSNTSHSSWVWTSSSSSPADASVN